MTRLAGAVAEAQVRQSNETFIKGVTYKSKHPEQGKQGRRYG